MEENEGALQPKKLTSVAYEGQVEPVVFVERISVGNLGVICDTYRYPENKHKDLGRIFIPPGMHTPTQVILRGVRTIEGLIAGRGYLQIYHAATQEMNVYAVDSFEKTSTFSLELQKGDVMRWVNDVGTHVPSYPGQGQNMLLVYEICYPPYRAGRYRDIDDVFWENPKNNYAALAVK